MHRTKFDLDAIAKSAVAKLNVGLTTYIEPSKKPKKKVSRPKGKHLTKAGKIEFCDLCEQAGLPRPIPEYKPFIDTHGRKHSIDFFFEKDGVKLSLEVEGWGHRTGARFEEDRWKYNEVAILRFHLLRVRPKELYKDETIDLLKRFFQL